MMKLSLQATAKFDPWFWLYWIVIVGWIIVQPNHWLGWVLLNLCLFQLISVLMIVPHEFGHAIAARAAGMRVISITIGAGAPLFTAQWFNLRWEIKRIPVGGITTFTGTSTHFYRCKVFLTILCGPGANLLMIVSALQFPQQWFLSHPSGIYLFPGIIFYAANALIILVNLLPHHAIIDGRKTPSDGLQLLTVPFLSQQEVLQNVALSIVLDGYDWQHRGNYEQALSSFNAAIQKHPACIQAYQGRGVVYQAIKAYDTAIADFDFAIQLDPQNAFSYCLRGITYCNWSKLEPIKLHTAIESLNQAIEVQSDLELAYYTRAVSYYYLGEGEKAIADFTTIIELNPNTNAYYNRGTLHYQCGNNQAAIADFDQAIKLNRRNLVAYYSRGNVRYQCQDQLGAFQDYDKAASLSRSETILPEDEHGFYARGMSYIHMRNKGAALNDLQTAEAICVKCGNQPLLGKIRAVINDL